MAARTIEIFLPEGEPTGIKVAHIRNRNIEATYIPRPKLPNIKSRDSLQGVGVYILVSWTDEHAKPRVYIGEAENVFVRLQQHHQTKDFWDYAITLTSNNRHLTKTHVKFLEWLCHRQATESKRATLENGNVPTKPHVPESIEADLHDNFETIDLLIATLGLKIFLPPVGALQENSDQSPLLILKGRGAEAKGRYTNEGFVVLAGAKVAKVVTPSFASNPPKIRQQLLMDGLLIDRGEWLELREDHLFSSPSLAAAIVVGNSMNGWISWKSTQGKTLDELYRQKLSA